MQSLTSPSRRGKRSSNHAVVVTFQRRHLHGAITLVIIVMQVAGMLKDKLNKRRRTQKESAAGEIVKSPVSPEKSSWDARRRSSRVSIKRNRGHSTVPTMPNGIDARAKLEHRLSSRENEAEAAKYSVERRDLILEESKASWDASARASASDPERQAERIIRSIREHDRIDPDVYGNVPGEAVPDPETRDMGGRFLVNKERIEKSKLFEIARDMPKGAHLHLHFNAELPPEMLFQWTGNVKDTMFVRSTQPLILDENHANRCVNFARAEIVFSVLPDDTPQADIFSKDYNANLKDPDKGPTWMLWRTFKERFPDHLFPSPLTTEMEPGSISGLSCRAECYVRDKVAITKGMAYNDRQTTNGAWACFNQGTRAFKGLLNYESAYEIYVGEMIDSMVRDKVMYAELRPMLLDKTIPRDNGREHLNHKDQMQLICRKVEAKKSELKNKGMLDKFPFGLKIIYCTPRSIPEKRMETELADCIQLKLDFPDLICGFDLVGAEDRPNHIGFYAKQLVAFTTTCQELGIEIPFMFHAGETLIDTGGSHNPENSNLYDSLLLGAKRIGHGYALLKHPTLLKRFVAQKICLELCPISNELLHLCTNARQHIFPELLAAGLHCTLNADNPSLFSSSLSHEFYQVMVGDPRMSVHGWKQLAEWSLEHSCLSKTQHAEAKQIFDREWDDFCKRVVAKYGVYADGLGELK